MIKTIGDVDPSNKNLKEEEVVILKEYSSAVHEEQLLFQQDKVDWIRSGDKNSKFFHAILKSRNNIRIIHSICNEEGVSFEGAKVREQFVNHFQAFLRKEVSARKVYPNTFRCCYTVHSEEFDYMEDEIKKTIFDIDDHKARVMEFFKSWKLPGEVNSTLFSLVPKVDTPHKNFEFRPIAYYDVIYKCINISKILRGYAWNNGAKRVAMKIDMQKAYDTVNWDFLEHGYFKGGMGLRQGDPISPYLFTVSVKVMKKALDEFTNLTNLKVFFGNLKEDVKKKILSALPFKVGRLLVTYLGVPLMNVRFSLTKGKAKVALKQVCKPKRQGGLRIKDLVDWNECLMGKHIWNVASKKETLWVKWINEVRLKGKSIWEIQVDSNLSYGWKIMLSLRDRMMNHVVKRIVADMINKGVWIWPNNMKDEMPVMCSVQVPISKDCTMWKNKEWNLKTFSVKRAWQDLRQEGNDVPWCKMIWFYHCILRNAFILWLAIIGRIATHDRIMKWYL
nr:hypothetical protein [Tanacetum cinerariifolium]